MTDPKFKLKWTIRLPAMLLVYHAVVHWISYTMFNTYLGGPFHDGTAPILYALEFPLVVFGYVIVCISKDLFGYLFTFFWPPLGVFLIGVFVWVGIGFVLGLAIDDFDFSALFNRLKRKKKQRRSQ